MRRLRQLLAVATVCSLSAFGVACGDDTTTATESNESRNDDSVDTPDDEGELRHVEPTCTPGETECTFGLTTGAQRDIEVELVNGEGRPVRDTTIEFEVENEGSTNVGTLTDSTYTDENGLASTTVDAGDIAGNATITASVSEHDELNSLTWQVAISSKDAAPYEVTFEHNGDTDIGQIDARLFDPSISCEELRNDPTRSAEKERSGDVSSSGTMPTIIFPDIQNGTSYTVAGYAHSLDNDDVEVAFGCEDDTDTVESGQTVEVTVDLYDHLPRVAGEYAVTHTFDLRDALPDRVRSVIDMIARLANDPGSFIVGCPEGGDDNCPEDANNVLDILLNFLPDGDIKDSIENFKNADLMNAAARDIINELTRDWRDAIPGLNETADVHETLSEFRIDGVIRIDEEPEPFFDDNTGEWVGELPADAGYQKWEEITVYWRRDCTDDDPADCGERTFGTRDLDINAIEGNFDGAVTASGGLEINEHTLSLNYGSFLLAVLETVLLPEIFGHNCGTNEDEACDSLERALESMISCGDVADTIADEEGSNVRSLVESMCTNLLSHASNELRAYAAEELVREDVVNIAGSSACQLGQPSSYDENWPDKPYPYTEHLGDEEDRCEWDVTINFTENRTAEVGGDFWGERTE